jgi:hypothetical protein
VLGTLVMNTCGLQHRLTDQILSQEPGPPFSMHHLSGFEAEHVELPRRLDLPEMEFRSPASAGQCRQIGAGDFGVIQQRCQPVAMCRSAATRCTRKDGRHNSRNAFDLMFVVRPASLRYLPESHTAPAAVPFSPYTFAPVADTSSVPSNS